MKKIIVILVLFCLSMVLYSQVNIVSKNTILYGKSNYSFDYSIMKDNGEISDYELAKLVNDKRMIQKIEWNINKSKREKTAGKIMFWSGMTAIIVGSIKIANSGQSNNYWENGLIFSGACLTFAGYPIMKRNYEYTQPIHYYHIEEARKNAEILNKQIK